MKKIINLRVKPSEATNHIAIRELIALNEGMKKRDVTGFHILKTSLDARSKHPFIQLRLEAFINEPFASRATAKFHFPDVSKCRKKVIIIGAGPAGLFSALTLIESGIKPVIIERGKDVRSRRRDLAKLNKEGIVNENSNYCFGEGGAGTYSDGKLYTRSNKRGDVDRILQLLVHFGAEEKILYESHPHIGTNKLPGIVTAISRQILDCGGEIHFDQRVTDIIAQNGTFSKVITAKDDEFGGDALILAVGHSARDIYHLFNEKEWKIDFKPFALGVRVEHPQELIDSIQYRCPLPDPYLPPASYSLVEQVGRKGVFSFCMCPGGIIAPASTAPGELVVNGWSPSKRNNPFANSGIVVSVEEEDVKSTEHPGPLAGVMFQSAVEKRAFNAGGGKFVAPAQRLMDFVDGKVSASLPDCSYLPGISSYHIGAVLPTFVHERLKNAFVMFGKKMKGYLTNEAVVVATESRTSSPIRIPRDPDTLQHVQIKLIFPCGEGAGYAGGIMSAAMDGDRVARMVVAGS